MSAVSNPSGGGIKSIQRGTITVSDNNLTNTATISAVVTTKSVISLTGPTSTDNVAPATNLNGPGAGGAYLILTNTTTLTLTRAIIYAANNTLTYGYQVVEYF